jgi:hypothetical protein
VGNQGVLLTVSLFHEQEQEDGATAGDERRPVHRPGPSVPSVKPEASARKLCRAPYAVENEARKGGREEVGAEKKEGVDTNVIAALVGEEDLSDGDLDQSLDSASEDALDASGQDPDGAGGDFPV